MKKQQFDFKGMYEIQLLIMLKTFDKQKEALNQCINLVETFIKKSTKFKRQLTDHSFKSVSDNSKYKDIVGEFTVFLKKILNSLTKKTAEQALIIKAFDTLVVKLNDLKKTHKDDVTILTKEISSCMNSIKGLAKECDSFNGSKNLKILNDVSTNKNIENYKKSNVDLGAVQSNVVSASETIDERTKVLYYQLEELLFKFEHMCKKFTLKLNEIREGFSNEIKKICDEKVSLQKELENAFAEYKQLSTRSLKFRFKKYEIPKLECKLELNFDPLEYAMEKILIIGGSGYIGQYLCKYLPTLLNDIAYYITFCTSDEFPTVHGSFKLNFNNRKRVVVRELRSIFEKVKPTVVINAMSLNIERSDADPEAAKKINDPSWWSDICTDFRCKLFIQFSTDLVYKGDSPPYEETNPAKPIKGFTYAHAKLAGEENLINSLNSALKWFILRVAPVIGPPAAFGKKKSLFDDIKKGVLNLEKGCYLPSDIYRSFVLIHDVVRVVAEIIRRYSELESSILNLGASDHCSVYELGTLIANKIGIENKLIRQMKYKDMVGSDELPKETQMCIAKLNSMLRIHTCTIEQSVDFILGKKDHPYHNFCA